LVGLSWPVFWSSLAAHPSESIHRKTTHRAELVQAEIDYYYKSRNEAARRWASPKNFADVSVAAGLKAEHSVSDRTAYLEQSRDRTQQALRMRPVDPGSWIRFAQLSLALGSSRETAAGILNLAFLTGAHSTRLRAAAAILGYGIWDVLSAGDRRHVMYASGVAWRERREHQDALLQAAWKTGSLEMLELALADDPVSREKMLRMEMHLTGVER
jgi:hypothetical protein